MKGSLCRWVARDWCDALSARSDDQLECLVVDRQARSVVNDEFECRTQYNNEWRLTPLKWAIDSRVPLERIRFLVHRAGAQVTHEALDRAVMAERWDVADYLHAMGARYAVAKSFVERIGHLFHNGDQESVLDLLFQYPEHWDTVRKYPNGPALIHLAQHRQKMAREAAAVVLATQKKKEKGIMCRDVATAVAKAVYEAKSSGRWGTPSTWDRVKQNAKNRPFLVLGFLFYVVVLICIFLMPHTANQSLTIESSNCTSLFYGPAGPPGLCRDDIKTINVIEAFTRSEGVGIAIPGASITIGNSWTVPGKCFAFPHNKTKL